MKDSNHGNLIDDDFEDDFTTSFQYKSIDEEGVKGSNGNNGVSQGFSRPLVIGLALFLLLLLMQRPVAAFLQPPSELADPVPLHSRLAAARCLAIFAFVVVLWATNALPLYITALLVAPLSVVLRVFLDDSGHTMAVDKAADLVLRSMGNDSVFMVLGVYVLSAALQKTSFEVLVSRAIFALAKSGTSLIAICMVLSVVVSLFFSNVLAPVLLLSILTPLFHSIGSENKNFIKAIILSISVASNIGGMPSPVASPQNIVTGEILRADGGVGFGTWMAVTLPQCAGMLFLGFLLIVFRFKVYDYEFNASDHVSHEEIKVSREDYIVLVTFVITVFLWIHPWGNALFGHNGVVSVIPLVLLFGSKTLVLNDFKNLPWNVVYLVAGGTCMGDAIKSSNLLNLFAYKLSKVLKSVSLFSAFIIVLLFMGVVASGISHTVSAIIVLPLVHEVGVDLCHPKLMVMGGVLAASGAMGLPVSSFPNMSAFGVSDPFGTPYLTSQDILFTGVPMTFACTLVIGTIGYIVMNAAF